MASYIWPPIGSGNTFTSIELDGATSGALTITVPSTVTSYTLVLPGAQGGAGTTLINDGSGNLSWQTSGGITIGTINSQTAVANGLQIIADVLYAQYATGSVPGMVSTAAQTIAGAKTFSSQPILSTLTASQAVFSDASKGLVSNAITGTGNVVMSASPTLTGTAGLANGTLSGTLGVTGVATFTAQPICSSLTVSQAIFTDTSKGLVSNAITGTGSVVMSASPTLTGTIGGASQTLTGTLALTSTTAALMSIGSGVSTGAKLIITGADTAMTTGSARGLNITWTSNSNNTGNVIGVIVGPTTAASTAVTHVTGFEADGATVGAGGSVATLIDFFTAGASSHHATNNAAFADNQAFSGNWFINQSGTDASKFGGATTLTNLAGTGTRTVMADTNGLLSAPVSDRRLKLDIKPLASQIDPVGALKALNGVFFNWNTSIDRVKGHGAQQEIGMIAQDVEKIIPQAVREDRDGWKSLDYSHLVPLLVEAIKFQQTQIEKLQEHLDR